MKGRLLGRLFNFGDGYTSVVTQQGHVALVADLSPAGPLYGIYKAIVVTTADPENQMRIQVKLLDAVMFALPCERWSRLFGQFFCFDKWSVCRG